MPAGKLCQFLLAGLACKNKKTRVVCIEEIQRLVEETGTGSLGRAGVREIAVYLDSKDNDVSGRHACLELCYVLFSSLGNDQGKLMKLLGELSERSAAMIEERIRQKLKVTPPVVAPPAPAPALVVAPASAASSLPVKQSVALSSPPKKTSPTLSRIAM